MNAERSEQRFRADAAVLDGVRLAGRGSIASRLLIGETDSRKSKLRATRSSFLSASSAAARKALRPSER